MKLGTERVTKSGSRYSIEAVAKALRVLDELAGRGTLTLSEASTAAVVSKSSAFRILATLEEAGVVQQMDGAGYAASDTFVRWAAQVFGQLDIRGLTLPLLRQLRDETGETANLAILRGRRIIYADVLESESTFRVTDRPGSEVFPHATSLGKAICAHQELGKLAALLGSEPFPALTKDTITTLDGLNAEFEQVRARGYAIDREERSRGVSCVAAPIVADGICDAAISISGPTVRMSEELLHSIGGRLVGVAREIVDHYRVSKVAADGIVRTAANAISG